MKRLAFFCDGTWNHSDAEHPTNVVKLAQALSLIDRGGVVQMPFYIPGVGNGRGSTRFAKMLDRLGGGAMGWGLTDAMIEAYRTLVFAYEPGDEIYIFGFSRGAFTARTFAGLIRSAGILQRAHIDQVPEALRRYRDRQRDSDGMGRYHPNKPVSSSFRHRFCVPLATGEAEVAWREEQGHERRDLLRIDYMGIWDTVGSLGVPNHWQSAGLFNTRHTFHDTSLSSMMKRARHAVSIDEKRINFAPTTWRNLAELNAASAQNGPAQNGPPFQEQWFPGDHGCVGGGGDLVGLSNATLLWVAEGAQAAGLEFDQSQLDRYHTEVDVKAPLRNMSKPLGFVDNLLKMRQKDRTGPSDPDHVADITKKRLREDFSYRPKTLDKVLPL